MYYYFRKIGNHWNCVLRNQNYPLSGAAVIQCGNDLDYPDGLSPMGNTIVNCSDGTSFTAKVYSDSGATAMAIARGLRFKKAAKKTRVKKTKKKAAKKKEAKKKRNKKS